jgi:ribose 5-phosphate isomerase B
MLSKGKVNMLFKKIVFASDHAGANLKNALLQMAKENGWAYEDLGPKDASTTTDYPDIVPEFSEKILKDENTCGVLICGTGIGMSIAANRIPRIRAALCYNILTTQLARQHNNANVLILGGRLTTPEVGRLCLMEFVITGFEGRRHENRLKKLELLAQ